MQEFAPAKINLYLHVTGKAANGYHLLESLVVFADVGDALEVIPATALTLAVRGEAQGLAADSTNSVLQAARRLQDMLGITAGADITLTKRLPVGAGVGGGSSDAAAALRLLQRLWQPQASGLPPEMLLGLGADVPVCFACKPAIMSGIGEVLTPVETLPELYAVLVNPRRPLMTKTVFAARSPSFYPALAPITRFADREVLLAFLRTTCNTLQETAIALMPDIAVLLAALEGEPHCRLARMSGSGATCFGLFPTWEAAQESGLSLQKRLPEAWVKPAKLTGVG